MMQLESFSATSNIWLLWSLRKQAKGSGNDPLCTKKIVFLERKTKITNICNTGKQDKENTDFCP